MKNCYKKYNLDTIYSFFNNTLRTIKFQIQLFSIKVKKNDCERHKEK